MGMGGMDPRTRQAAPYAAGAFITASAAVTTESMHLAHRAPAPPQPVPAAADVPVPVQAGAETATTQTAAAAAAAEPVAADVADGAVPDAAHAAQQVLMDAEMQAAPLGDEMIATSRRSARWATAFALGSAVATAALGVGGALAYNRPVNEGV
jgi:hypothetical protein